VAVAPSDSVVTIPADVVGELRTFSPLPVPATWTRVPTEIEPALAVDVELGAAAFDADVVLPELDEAGAGAAELDEPAPADELTTDGKIAQACSHTRSSATLETTELGQPVVAAEPAGVLT